MNKNSKNLFLVLLLCIFTLIGCKFEIQGENKDLIYFNGLDSNFNNLEFSMDNNTLIITSKVEELKENTTNKTLLLLEKTENSTVQSVKAKISELTPGTTTIYDF